MHKDRCSTPTLDGRALARALPVLVALFWAAPAALAIEVHYSYNPLGQLTGVRIGDGSTLDYAHDRAANRQQLSIARAAAGPDSDGDGLPDGLDLCPLAADPAQRDNDGDGQGDPCDPDDDNDGVPDAQDAFPFDATESADQDGDGIGNNADPDDDGDGILDAAPDNCPLDHNPDQSDSDHDRLGDACDDEQFCTPCLPGSAGWRLHFYQ